MAFCELPPDVELIRTTETFDNDTVPPSSAPIESPTACGDGSSSAQAYSASSSTMTLRVPVVVDTGHPVVIPPARVYHLELHERVTFAVEFYRAVAASGPTRTRPHREPL